MIRAATGTDYDHVMALVPELGVDDPVPTRDHWISQIAPHTRIAERDGAVLGYISFRRMIDVGHVRNLVTAPHARGRGIGSELMHAAAAEMRAAGLAEWQLNVKVDNRPALELYTRLGLKVEHRTTALRVAWALVDRLSHATSLSSATNVVALPLAESEDDDVERALGMLAGRIAMSRNHSNPRYFYQLRDETCAAVGFACFDAAYPGAMPFRVARPELAVGLLAALRPHANAGDAAFQLVIDDDQALVERMIAAGAEVRTQLLNLRGPLPVSQPDRAA